MGPARGEARPESANLTPPLEGDAARATTSQGEANNDFGPALKADSEGRGAVLRSTATQGPEIVLSTERGSITVRKDTGAPMESKSKRMLEVEAEGGRARVQKY